MPGATISYSGMERRWFVWPGQGRPSLTFTDKASAVAAKAAIDAGKPVVLGVDLAPAGSDKTVFLPSRSSKAEPFAGLDVEKPPVQTGRPMPKWPGRSAKIAATTPRQSKHGRVALDIEKARRVYEATGSLAKTAARFGVGWMTVRRHFRKAGVPIRPPVRPGSR